MTNFADHFSAHADTYALHRPTYPPELFEYLASLTSGHEIAWDCGTGNGQAALGLTRYYSRIIATDASEQQLANAYPHERVTYRQSPAEESGIPSGSVDLVTAAQAVHWFDMPRFYEEARRVLKPAGVIAVWCYTQCKVTPEIDAVITAFYYEVVGPYWPDRFELVDDGYRSIAFPFHEVQPPELNIEREWNMEEMLDFIGTWSPTHRFIAANGYDPVNLIRDSLAQAWNDPDQRRRVEWPIRMRVGRV